jgi:hypothetical protein
MKISVTRTGGFAGLTESLGNVDTAALPPAQAAEAARLVQAAGFFALPGELPGGNVGADLFRYEVRVEDGARSHAVAFQDGGQGRPGALPELVAWVKQTAAGR